MSLLRGIAAFCIFTVSTLPSFGQTIAVPDTTEVPTSLTLERITSHPEFDNQPPKAIKFRPAQQQVSYLKTNPADPRNYEFWVYDIRAEQHQRLLSSVSATPDNTRELPKFTSTTTPAKALAELADYQWSADGLQLLLPVQGQLYLFRFTSSGEYSLTPLIRDDYRATDARFSPTGRFVSFVHADNLYLIDIANHNDTDALPEVLPVIDNRQEEKLAVADAIARRQLNRSTGYWWASDGGAIALTKMGDTVDLGVVTIATAQTEPTLSEPHWLQLNELGDGYLTQVDWLADGSQLSYQWQPRSQQSLELRLTDPEFKQTAAEHSVLLTEQSDTWVNTHSNLTFLRDGKHFLWASERSGFKHLYLYRLDGKLIRQLTSGSWAVDRIHQIDETAGVVYFTAREKSPLERHLYRANMTTSSPSQPTRISAPNGVHSIQFAPDARSFIDYFSSPTQPEQISLNGPTGQRITWLHENKLTPQHPLNPYLANWQYPEFGSLTNNNGDTLHYRLTKPANFDEATKYPVIVQLNNAPQTQSVTNSWGGDFAPYFEQYLAQQGYLVFRLDSRGSAARGTEFESANYQALGTVELADQRIGVQYLTSLAYVDANRIGVMGNGYGGFLSLLAMLKEHDIYAAGVAGTPITDWQLYNPYFSERYLGQPGTNPEAYARANVQRYVTPLADNHVHKPLLVYQALADEEIQPKHAERLFQKLQQQGYRFEMMSYPGQQKNFADERVNLHRYRLIVDFFDRHLGE